MTLPRVPAPVARPAPLRGEKKSILKDTWDESNAMPQTLPHSFLLAEGKPKDFENY